MSLADGQAKKGSALHPSVAQVEQSYNARASFLVVGEAPASASRTSDIQRPAWRPECSGSGAPCPGGW